nr:MULTISPECIES: sodium:solute symporter family protein [unclassified Fusobacterium]
MQQIGVTSVRDIILILYFFLVVIVGFISFGQIKDDRDFFVAGKNAGILQVSGSLLASILGSSAILGSVDFAYSVGWAGSWLMLCGAFGLLMLYPLTKYIKNFQGYNLPNLLGNFYGEEVQRISSFIIPIAWLGIVASQIMGAAKIITIISSYTYIEGVWLSSFVFIVYTILGGQFSIIKTDMIQLLFILLGLVVTFVYISPEPITKDVLPMINEKFSYMDLLVMILTYSTTYLVGPDIYSRLFCAKSEKTMKSSILIAIIVLIPLGFILAKLGIYGAEVFDNIGSNSVLLLIADSKLPKILSFLLYLGLLSAVISSADTTLLTASSLFTQGIIKDLKSEKAVFISRVLTVVFGVGAMFIAIKMKYILSTLLLALTIYSGAFIIPTFVGMFGYRVRKEVVILAIIVGGGVATYGKLYGGASGKLIAIAAFILNGAILYIGKKLEKSK